MLFVKLLFLTMICGATAQNRFHPNKICFEKVPYLVQNVITKLNAQDRSTRDVVLLKLGVFESSRQIIDDFHNNLLQLVPKENAIVTPRSDETTKVRSVRKNVVIVIISDVSDSVSC